MKIRSNIARTVHFAGYQFKPFRPALIFRQLMKRTAGRLLGRKGFRIIDLALTYNCNLKCEHCSSEPLKRNAPQLSLENYREIVRQSRDLDLLSWNITGGEPLLVRWLEDLISILEPSRHYISIQTNALLLTPEKAQSLARLGVNCITTSIDSPDPDEHDRFRGVKNAFRKTFQGIENAKKAGLSVLIGATVTHQNLRTEGLERIIKKANNAGAIMLFNLAIPCGRWHGNYDICLRGDDREYLARLMEKYPRTSTDHEPGRNAVGCPAGMEKIYITPTGEVLPCPFIHVSFGNIKEQPLVEIVERMRRISYFNRYQNVCIAAEDPQFQQEVISRTDPEKYNLPISWERIFEN